MWPTKNIFKVQNRTKELRLLLTGLRGYEIIEGVEVSFSEVFEKGNVMAADWKGLFSACGTNKRLRTGFQHSQHGQSEGIRGHPLD